MSTELITLVKEWKKPALKEDIENLIGEIETVWANFKQPAVKDGTEYKSASEERKALKTYQKQLEEARKGFTVPIDNLKRAIQDYFAKRADILTAALRQVDGAMLAYDAEIQRIRQEEQRKLEEAIRKREAEEKARLEAAALKALQQGNEARAVELVTKAEEVKHAVPILAPVKIETPGTATRAVLKYEITDPDLVERELCEPSAGKVWAKVKIVGAKGSIPGVRIWEEKILSGTR